MSLSKWSLKNQLTTYLYTDDTDFLIVENLTKQLKNDFNKYVSTTTTR